MEESQTKTPEANHNDAIDMIITGSLLCSYRPDWPANRRDPTGNYTCFHLWYRSGGGVQKLVSESSANPSSVRRFAMHDTSTQHNCPSVGGSVEDSLPQPPISNVNSACKSSEAIVGQRVRSENRETSRMTDQELDCEIGG